MSRLLPAALLLLAALAAPTAHAAHKREEMLSAPFLVASRYGRSVPRLVAPRNDMFFMNGRYGKRSEVPLPPSPSGAPPGARPTARGGGGRGARSLLCEYTGVYPLYRCLAPHSRNYRSSYEEGGV